VSRPIVPPDGRHPFRASDPNGPGLRELERFSRKSLKQWRDAAERLTRMQAALYYGLELALGRRGARLLAALRFAAKSEFTFTHWSRIVDH
jgi:hypothetical protein